MSILSKLFGSGDEQGPNKADVIGLLMKLLNSGGEMAKILPLVSPFITHDNIQAVVVELHKMYAAEAAKLGDGHILKIMLSPNFERQGLELWFVDHFQGQSEIAKKIFLKDITPEMIQELIAKATTQAAPQDNTLLTEKTTTNEETNI